MEILFLALSNIHFEEKTYSISLYESIQRISLNFPIQVTCDENGCYHCVDGHKRLSVIQQILQEQCDHPKFQTIRCVLHSSRSAPPNFLRNHH